MYNPTRFKSIDRKEAFVLMEKNPFATLISVVNNEPFVSHLPLTPLMWGDNVELIGHLAKANPHWKAFLNSKVTVIFNGPHTYITPKWYAENDVPTWNYATVHVKGSVELIEDVEGIINCLKHLTEHVERFWPSGWQFFIPEDLGPQVLPKSIVGFRVKVEEVDFKKKLSQNRTPADRSGVLTGLRQRDDDNSKEILAEMLKLYSLDGETL